jgi:hypothetical protein
MTALSSDRCDLRKLDGLDLYLVVKAIVCFEIYVVSHRRCHAKSNSEASILYQIFVRYDWLSFAIHRFGTFNIVDCDLLENQISLFSLAAICMNELARKGEARHVSGPVGVRR